MSGPSRIEQGRSFARRLQRAGAGVPRLRLVRDDERSGSPATAEPNPVFMGVETATVSGHAAFVGYMTVDSDGERRDPIVRIELPWSCATATGVPTAIRALIALVLEQHELQDRRQPTLELVR